MVAHVEAVVRAGGVVVVLGVALDQPVVGGVVDAPQRQRGPEVVALGGVVVDHVEDDLDAGPVQRPDHGLELLYLLPAGAKEAGVVVVRGEKADRVIAPVVAQAPLGEGAVVHVLVHRHQLDGGHSQSLEMRDHDGMSQAGVAASGLGGNLGMAHRHALDVRLVDHRLVIGNAQRSVVVPVEERGDHDRLHGIRGGIGVVHRLRLAEPVGKQRLVPLDAPIDRLGVGIQQQLVRIASMPSRRFVRAVHPIAVALTGPHAGQVAVPDQRIAFR